MSCIKKCELLDLETKFQNNCTYEQACWIAYQYCHSIDDPEMEFIDCDESRFNSLLYADNAIRNLLISAVANAFEKSDITRVEDDIISMCVIDTFPKEQEHTLT